jgi:hypothetical protein
MSKSLEASAVYWLRSLYLHSILHCEDDSETGLAADHPGNIPDDEGVASGWHVWLDDFERHLLGEPVSLEAHTAKGEWQRLGALYRPMIEESLGIGRP